MLQVWKAIVAAALCVASGVHAQVDYDHASGPLVVWVISPATAEEHARLMLRKSAAARKLPTTVQQSTTADFGQTSSTYGQTSGSYGTPSANVGRNASDTGRTAGDHGQTSSSLASTVQSTSAGSFGQTAGSFGQASSTFGIGFVDPASSTGAGGRTTVLPAPSERRFLIRNDVVPAFPNLQIRFVDVLDETLQESLQGAQRTDAFPDVVVGALPSWWDESGWGVAMLGSLRFQDVTHKEYQEWFSKLGRPAVLLRAPHPQQARAFVLWLRDRELCRACLEGPVAKELTHPVSVAVRAVGRILSGGSLGADADESAAQFSPEMAMRSTWHASTEEALNKLQMRVDVLNAGANDRLAVVMLRVVATSETAFGATQAVVVLRKATGGRWKVLQISCGVAPGLLRAVGGDLLAYTRDKPPAHVVGVSLAAPVDGDIRPLQPELWWDNGGGASLLAVEWQRRAGAWSDTKLMLVPDDSSRVQTRVPATFADAGGDYRWRVWSLGDGGALVLSAWKMFKVLP